MRVEWESFKERWCRMGDQRDFDGYLDLHAVTEEGVRLGTYVDPNCIGCAEKDAGRCEEWRTPAKRDTNYGCKVKADA